MKTNIIYVTAYSKAIECGENLGFEPKKPAHYIATLEIGDDGQYYCWFTGAGAWSEWVMGDIVDYMQELNGGERERILEDLNSPCPVIDLCETCGKPAQHIDDNGVGLCEIHFKEAIKELNQ